VQPRAFQIDFADDVATLIEDAPEGVVKCIGAAGARDLVCRQKIARGHKIALRAFHSGDAVTKFGVRIGHATQPIEAGDWVHLHNLASDLDERSGTLDLQSGAPTDMASAYV
jgi:altronate dehydratase small subunit